MSLPSNMRVNVDQSSNITRTQPVDSDVGEPGYRRAPPRGDRASTSRASRTFAGSRPPDVLTPARWYRSLTQRWETREASGMDDAFRPPALEVPDELVGPRVR